MSWVPLQTRVCEANREIARVRLAMLTWGNASEADREAGVFAIKPSGVAYADLCPDQVPVISLETGEQVGGSLKPSSDTATHLHLYRKFSGIGGVVHTHSFHATAWAQAQKPIPCLGTTHADTFYGEVPCTRPLTRPEVENGYEHNTGKVIVEHFQRTGIAPLAVPGVLVAAHAPFTWGRDAMAALMHARILEEVAGMALHTLALRPEISEVDAFLLEKHYSRKHGPNATYGQNKN